MMLTQDEIKTHIAQAAKELHAQSALLFGSYARGEATEDSDVDVLFVAESDLPRPLRSAQAYPLLDDLDCPKDVLVYTPDEFQRWQLVPGALCYNVVHECVKVL